MWSAWWAWALLGAALAIFEVLAPSYIALGFGIGAGVVAVGLFTGIWEAILPLSGDYGLAILLLVFAVLSGLSWWGLRAVFGPPGGTVQTFDKDVND